MRPTFVAASDMPSPKVYNLWWGDSGVQPQKGTVQYAVSPMRQRAAHNLFRNYLFNGYRRLASQVPYWIVPVAIGYGTYAWAKKYDAYQNSKAAHVAGHGAH